MALLIDDKGQRLKRKTPRPLQMSKSRKDRQLDKVLGIKS
jgi:hypothetical protein